MAAACLVQAVFGCFGGGGFGGSRVIFGKPPSLISGSISLLGCLGYDGFGWEWLHHFEGGSISIGFVADLHGSVSSLPLGVGEAPSILGVGVTSILLSHVWCRPFLAVLAGAYSVEACEFWEGAGAMVWWERLHFWRGFIFVGLRSSFIWGAASLLFSMGAVPSISGELSFALAGVFLFFGLGVA